MLDQEGTEDLQSRLGDDKYLPPIHRIKLPETKTQSCLIRWLFGVGYKVKDISNGLNIRYQQVRNIVTTEPKRAAREDLPPLTIELADIEDVVDTLLGDELERTHLAARKNERKETNKKRRALVEEPVGAELDDEDYHHRDDTNF